MRLLLQSLDVLARHALAGRPLPLLPLLACVGTGGAFYGAAMGSFGARSDGHILLAVFAAIKVPLLLLVCFLLTLPIFLVLNTLRGLRADLGDVVRAVLSGQATLALLLAALAPYTLVWYATSGNYEAAQLFNLAMFSVASLSTQVVLRRHYRILIARDPRHRQLLWLWLFLYAFVAIQMAWVLRPFIGDPRSEVQFFRPDAFGDNAYMVVLRLIWGKLTH